MRRYILDQVYDEVCPLAFNVGFDSFLEQAVIRALADENILKPQAEEK